MCYERSGNECSLIIANWNFIHQFFTNLKTFSLQAQKCAINVELVGDDYRELKGEIAGPPDTPYEGATFHLEIKVPETYPFNPPKVISVMCQYV